MWICKRLVVDKTEEREVLILGPVCTVGRNAHDVLSFQDKSISRNHAEFHVTKVVDNEIILQLKDVSKYGCFFYNPVDKHETKILKNTMIPIENGQCIKFGSSNQVYKLIKQDILFCVTGLNSEEQAYVSDMAELLSGMVTSNPESATHFVTSKIKLTAKILYAIAYQKPIVSLAWFDFALPLKENGPGASSSLIISPYKEYSPSNGGIVIADMALSREKVLEYAAVFVTDKSPYRALLEKCGATAYLITGCSKNKDLKSQITSIGVSNTCTDAYVLLDESFNYELVIDYSCKNNIPLSILSSNTLAASITANVSVKSLCKDQKRVASSLLSCSDIAVSSQPTTTNVDVSDHEGLQTAIGVSGNSKSTSHLSVSKSKQNLLSNAVEIPKSSQANHLRKYRIGNTDNMLHNMLHNSNAERQDDDGDGWIAIPQAEEKQMLMSKKRKTWLMSCDNSENVHTYIPPETIERAVLKSKVTEANQMNIVRELHEQVSAAHQNDKRKFRKNVIRLASKQDILEHFDMDQVLPKESERELQLRLAADREQKVNEISEQLFFEKLTTKSSRK